jgi:hypothetical protein
MRGSPPGRISAAMAGCTWGEWRRDPNTGYVDVPTSQSNGMRDHDATAKAAFCRGSSNTFRSEPLMTDGTRTPQMRLPAAASRSTAATNSAPMRCALGAAGRMFQLDGKVIPKSPRSTMLPSGTSIAATVNSTTFSHPGRATTSRIARDSTPARCSASRRGRPTRWNPEDRKPRAGACWLGRRASIASRQSGPPSAWVCSSFNTMRSPSAVLINSTGVAPPRAKLRVCM